MEERSKKFKSLATSAARITKSIFANRGLADGMIVREWAAIVGPLLSSHSLPEKITYPAGARGGGTLFLRAQSGGPATEIQHLEPLIVERINTYFGYRAVAKLKLIQRPLPKMLEPPALPHQEPLNPAQENFLEDLLSAIDDPELRVRLEALGRSVLGRDAKN